MEVRAQAQRFEAAKVLPPEVAQAILGKNFVKSRHSGWAHYYLLDREVWGSHLPPEAFFILCHMAETPCEEQRILWAWIAGGPYRGGRDFFTQTQVKGRRIPAPPVEVSEPRLAVQLGRI